MEGFSFETEKLDYGAIEDAICKHYGLIYPSSSNFTELEVGKGQSLTIIAENGSICCGATAYKKKDSDKYIVSISSANVKYKKR